MLLKNPLFSKKLILYKDAELTIPCRTYNVAFFGEKARATSSGGKPWIFGTANKLTFVNKTTYKLSVAGEMRYFSANELSCTQLYTYNPSKTPYENLLAKYKAIKDRNDNSVNPYTDEITNRLKLTKYELIAKINGYRVKSVCLREIKNYYGIEAKSASQCYERFLPLYNQFFKEHK